MKEQVPWEQPLAGKTVEKALAACGIGEDTDRSSFRLLDFGCGNGRYLEAFAGRLPKEGLYGAEADPQRVNEVKAKGFQCSLLDPANVVFPFAAGWFDVLFSSNVIEHMPRKVYLESLRQIHRVLKNGGRFVVGTPNYPVKRFYDMWKAATKGFARYYLLDDPTHCNKLSVLRLEKDLKALFREVHLEPTYIAFERWVPWLRRPNVRRSLRILGDKVFGYCIK